MPAVFLLVALLFVTLLVAAGVYGSKQRRKKILATAEALGLTYHPGGLRSGSERLTGRMRGVPVTRRNHVVSTGKTTQVYTRYCAGGLHPSVTFRRQGFGQGLLTALGAQDLLVGDPAFDAAVVVKGAPVPVAASLSAEARAALAGVFAAHSNAWVEKGELVVQVSGDHVDLEKVRAGLEEVAAAAALLALPPGREVERLCEVAASDPVATVRARALALVVEAEAGPHGAVARATVTAALGDPDPSVRLVAALARGDEPGLRALLDAPELPALRRVEVLARLGDPTLVGRAVALFGHEDVAVRASAARLVGVLGTVDEVPLLHALAENGGERVVRQTAREAMRAIQSRLVGVEGGRVTLADDSAAGALAVAPEVPAAGELALAPEEAAARAAARRPQRT